ncbi:MAG: DUF4160 domain-containing protein [Caldilineaceae bacterium]|nr:DUF4160 domain-containing protein [Caldilineaceae bacterium]
MAKFWLRPVSFAKNRGFSENELNRIVRLVIKNEEKLFEAWNEYFST